MTIWYRVTGLNNIKEVFSGEGGLFAPARWNHLGRKAIYCSESISLCTLEWLSHNGLSVSGFNYFRYSIEIPDKFIKRFSVSELPKEWNYTPATDITRDFAESHLFTMDRYVAIALPSVVVPEEFNLVINPMHVQFPKLAKTAEQLGEYVAPIRH